MSFLYETKHVALIGPWNLLKERIEIIEIPSWPRVYFHHWHYFNSRSILEAYYIPVTTEIILDKIIEMYVTILINYLKSKHETMKINNFTNTFDSAKSKRQSTQSSFHVLRVQTNSNTVMHLEF